MATHLGETSEEKINNMSYIWFGLILEALGKKLNYDSIVNLLGNSFAKDAAKAVAAANPLKASDRGTGGAGAAFANMVGNIKILDKKGGDDSSIFGGSDTPLGDISWINDLRAKKE